MYKRILLKLSGEALSGDEGFGIDPTVLDNISDSIKKVHDKGVEIGIVVGGGNFWRGKFAPNMAFGPFFERITIIKNKWKIKRELLK